MPSPDGKTFALTAPSYNCSRFGGTFPQPFDEGAMHWSADSRSVIGHTISAGAENLLRIDIGTGTTTPMTRFSDSQTLFSFAVDRDGRLATVRGETSNDVVLIRRR